jgi:hypothetical protein
MHTLKTITNLLPLAVLNIWRRTDIELSIYLGRHPSPSPLLSPDVLADVDVVYLKLSIVSDHITCSVFTDH